MGLSIWPVSSLGWPISTMPAPVSVLKRPSIAAMAAGWLRATYLPCRSPVGKMMTMEAITPAITPTLRKMRRVVLAPPLQQIKCAHGGHDKRAGDHRAGHVVRVLQQAPGIQQQLPEAEHLELAVGQPVIGHRMLHPGVGDDDEESRDPRSHERPSPPRTSASSLEMRFSP